MISNEQMDKLTAIANLMEVGRLAIIGDRKQLNPIAAGKRFSLMQARAIQDQLPVSEVNINMRPTNEIGRASCRARVGPNVYITVVAVSSTKQTILKTTTNIKH